MDNGWIYNGKWNIFHPNLALWQDGEANTNKNLFEEAIYMRYSQTEDSDEKYTPFKKKDDAFDDVGLPKMGKTTR